MRGYDISEMGFWSLVSGMLQLLKSHKFRTVFLVFLMLGSSVFEAVGVSAVVPILQVFVGGGDQTDASNRILAFYADLLGDLSPEDRLAWIGLGIVLIFGFRYLLSYCVGMMGDRMSYSLFVEIRQKVLQFYLCQPYRFFLDRKQGQLINDLSKEPGFLSQSLKDLITFISAGLSGGALLCVLVLISWQGTLVVVVIGGMMWGISQGFKTWVHKIGVEGLGIRRDVMAFPAEVISGIRQVKVFSAEERLKAVFARIGRAEFQNSIKLARATHLIKNLNQLLVIAVFGFGLYLGIRLGLFTPQTAAVSLLPFFAVASRATPYLSLVSEFQMKVKARGASMGVLMPMILEKGTEKPRREEATFNALTRNIAFEDVSFRYHDDQAVLDRVSTTFECGRTTAIVGPSGSGKSTMVDLIIRLFEPLSGRITADGINLRTYDLSTWLNAIGFVSQDTFIFHGTIGENIAFSRPDATFEEVMAAAELANAHGFIESLAEGYDTIVGDRGVKLSGGQRQRIAIARAILRDPQILILDEATSALDTVSERQVQKAIERVSQNRTVIVVAHRLSTIRNADKIVVLDKGQVVEEGTHGELMDREGLYWQLYSGAERSRVPIDRIEQIA